MSYLRASRLGRCAPMAALVALTVFSRAAASAEPNAASLVDASVFEGRQLQECPCDSQIPAATKEYLCTSHKSVYCDPVCANGGGGLWCNACGIDGCRFCKFDCNTGGYQDPATECITCPTNSIDYCTPTQPPSPASTPMPTVTAATPMPTGTAATPMPTIAAATPTPTLAVETAMPTPMPSTPGGMGNDPHVWGFRGQAFYFNGAKRDSFYALAHDRALSINARTAPRYANNAALPYSDLVSLGISTRTPGGGSGAVSHEIGIFSTLDACAKGSICLMPRYGIQVVLDGEAVPLGLHSIDDGLKIAVMQVPHPCKRDRDANDRAHGMYDEEGGESRPLVSRRLMATEAQMKAEQTKTSNSARSADGFDVSEWLASGPIGGAPSEANDFTNECLAWLEGRDIFAPRLDGLLTTILIKTQEVTMRIEHWGFDVDEGADAAAAGALPLMLNLYLDGWVPSATAHGILGQTVREAKPGMPGLEGLERDYITSGPFSTSFKFYP